MADTESEFPVFEGAITFSVGFLLVDKFTLVALSTAIEPLRMANQLTGETLYRWRTISADGKPVCSSDGVEVVPDESVAGDGRYDMVIVAAGNDVTTSFSSSEINWLRRKAKEKATLGAVCTGAYVLARAGLLDGYGCSAHWECLSALQEDCPKVYTNTQLFTFDRDRITCTGGDVPIHMMMNLVSMHHGQQLANAISDMFVCERIREGHEPQRLMMERQVSANQPKLAEAVQLMQANLEEPLELNRIAELTGISRRQLERLFLSHLGLSPSRFYLKLRLEKAQHLLRQTARPIVEIAMMCGFISATHFSRCYRKYMGKPPRAERAPRAASGKLAPSTSAAVVTGASVPGIISADAAGSE